MEGRPFCSQINADCHSGTVYDETGTGAWTYHLRKPDFVFKATDSESEVLVRKVSLLRSTFAVWDNDTPAGQIRLASPLRNKYTIALPDVGPLTLHLPLFTTRFSATREGEPVIWGYYGTSKRQWDLLLAPTLPPFPLLAALSFLHHEWWNYS